MIEIVQTGDPVLRKIGRTLDRREFPELAELIKEMKETMRSAPGVGLAAPQSANRFSSP